MSLDIEDFQKEIKKDLAEIGRLEKIVQGVDLIPKAARQSEPPSNHQNLTMARQTLNFKFTHTNGGIQIP